MSAGRLVVVPLLASVVAACSSPDAAHAPTPRPVELHAIDAAPTWAVRYGAEFWRPHASEPAPTAAPGTSISAELDLNETMERVEHAFTADAAGELAAESAAYRAIVDGRTVRFISTERKAAPADAALSLRTLERGDEAWDAAAPGEAFVLGNTYQRRLALGAATVIEHVEARRDGVELTWVLPAAPTGTGPLHLAFAVDGLTPAGRSAAGHHFADADGVPRVRVSDAVLRDATGSEWKLALTDDAHGLGLDVPADVLASAHYPLAIDPVIGAEFGMDTPTSSNVVSDPSSLHRVVCGGGTCLAAWVDNRSNTQQAWATRINPSTGSPLDPLGFPLTEGPSYYFDLAYTGSDFLIAYYTYTENAVRARRITTSGTTPDPSFLVGAGTTPAIASSGSSSLIVYSANNDIHATLISGGAISVADVAISTASEAETNPDVAWDGAGYVVTWTRTGSDTDVMIARVDGTGAVTSAPAVLAGGAGYQQDASVCGGTPGALVVWTDYATGATNFRRYDGSFVQQGAAATSLGAMNQWPTCASNGSSYLVLSSTNRNVVNKATGAISFAAPGLANPSTFIYPGVTFDGTRYLAEFGTSVDVSTFGYVRRFGVDGSSVDASAIALQQVAAMQRGPSVASGIYGGAAKHAVVWTQNLESGAVARGVVLDDTGTAVDPAGFQLGTLQGNESPSVAAGSTGFVAVWARSATVIASRAVSPTSTLSAAFQVTTNGSYTPTLAFDGSAFVAAWREWGATEDIHAAAITAAGSIGTPFDVATTASSERAPVVTCITSTRRCLIAFTSFESTNLPKARLVQSGALTADATIQLDTGYADSVTVANNGTTFLASYYDFLSNSERATRVGSDGSVLGTTSVFTRLERSTFDGTNYVLVGRDSGGLELTQLSPSGTLLGTTPVPLTTTPNEVALSSAGNRRSLVVYPTYDATLHSLRIKGRFVAFTSVPVASAASTTTTEDTAKAITLSATDADGDALTYSIVTPPVHGTLTGTAPALTYTPAANYNGSDTFTFKANDGGQDSNTATINITISPVNDAPVASDASITSTEDKVFALSLVATDVDSPSLTYTIVTPPAHGTLMGTAPDFYYQPTANYYGPDSFTFQASDGALSSNIATVALTITSVNDLPYAHGASMVLYEDTPTALTLGADDADGDPLTYRLLVTPSHGTLTGTAPNLIYTPDPNYNGSDYFSFVVNDGTVDSDWAPVGITIYPVNDAPVATPQSLTTAEDTPITFAVGGTDVDSPTLFYGAFTAPAHGTISGTPSAVTYTPNPNYAGPDSFTFRVSDGALTSAPATISIVVTPVPDPPTASAQSVTVAEDGSTAITLTGSDPDNDPVTFTVATQPAHGTLSGTAPNLTYTPAANYSGADSFTFTAHDGTFSSAPATISITVTPVPDPPTASAQNVTVAEDGSTAILLTGSDPDNDPLTFTVTTQPAHGTLSGTAPNLTYTPAANYNGPDSFVFTAHDGTFDSAPATVSISVTPTNDPPVATAQMAMTAEDTPVAITLAGSDLDGDALTFSIAMPPAHGTLTGTAPNLTYTPAANFHGTDGFTFTAHDGTVASAAAAVTLTITSVDDAPVATAQSVTTAEDTEVAITLGGTDVEGDTLSFAIATQPAHGTLSGTAPDLTYTPAANYHGADSFTFTVNDGTLTSSAATVSLTVSSANDAPVAVSQTYSVDQGAQIDITLAATDADGDAVTYTIATQPDQGTLTGTPPALTYAAPSGFRGTTTFTYTASDGTLTSAIATVMINVNNGAPTVSAAADSANPVEGQEVHFTATAADPGGDDLTFAWDFGDGATSTEQNPSHTYTDEGARTATVTVSDGIDTATATVDLTVQNGAPIIVPATDSVTGDEATQLTFTITVSDPGAIDTHTTTWSWGDNSPASTGDTATHTYADNGSYTVTVTVTDNGGATVTGTRTVVIANVAPMPAVQDALLTDVGVEVTAQLSATDRAGAADPLTWTLVDGPGELSSDGAYRWTPATTDAGTHVVTAEVRDDDGGASQVTFSVEVMAPASDDGGCGCRTTGGSPATSVLVLGAVAFMLRRRRAK